MKNYKVVWRLKGFKEWQTSTIWACNEKEAYRIKANESHMIELRSFPK